MAAASIVVDLLMKTGSFETDTKRAEKALANFERKAKETGKAVGLAFVAAGTAIAASVKLSIDSFDELSKAAQKIGVSTEALSALKYAADLSDVSFESLQTAIGKLSVNIENFREGAKSAVDTFNKIGLDPTQFATTDALLSEIADKFAALPDGAQKSALAVELFGKAGRDLIPFLNQGKDGIKQLTDEAAKLGVVISTQTGAAAEQFNDNLTRLKTAVTGFRSQLAIELLPTLTDVSNAFIEVSTQSINLKNETGGEALGTDIAIGFAKLADTLTVIPELFTAIRASISAIIADIVLLKDAFNLLNPATLTARLFLDTNTLADFKNSLETRKSLAADAEKALIKLLNEENNKYERAVRERLEFRINYINQYAKRALDVQKAYVNESVEVQQAAQRELAKNLGFRLPSSSGVLGTDAASSTAARNSAIRSVDQAKLAADNFVASLKREAETLGFTSEELKRYEANQLKLTATQKGVVDVLLSKISAYNAEQEAIKANEEAAKRAAAETEALINRAKQITEDVRTSTEKLNDEINQYNILLDKGYITAETLERKLNQIAQTSMPRNVAEAEEFAKMLLDAGANAEKVKEALDEVTFADQLQQLRDAKAVMDAQFNLAKAMVSARKESGFFTDLESLRAQGEVNKERIKQLEAYKASLQGMAAAAGQYSSAIQAEILNIQAEIETLSAQIDLVANKVRGIFEEAFANAFEGILNGTLTFKQAFIQIWRDIVREINRIIARELAQQLMKLLGGGLTPGGGTGIFGFIGNILSPVDNVPGLSSILGVFGGGRASGGDVMSGRSYLVGEHGPEMFIPRTAGTIAPNSQLTQSAPQVNVRNINVLDPSLVGDYLATDSGEQLIMNVLQRNRRALAF
jgi:hypothetical protein